MGPSLRRRTANIDAAVDSWYNEVKDFKAADVDSYK
jgi:hypothetical protein